MARTVPLEPSGSTEVACRSQPSGNRVYDIVPLDPDEANQFSVSFFSAASQPKIPLALVPAGLPFTSPLQSTRIKPSCIRYVMCATSESPSVTSNFRDAQQMCSGTMARATKPTYFVDAADDCRTNRDLGGRGLSPETCSNTSVLRSTIVAFHWLTF